jgi:(R,R)-butanediol dehydrogenase / meso-butanediol dehydrogenase / diacetyl reductase
MQALRWHGARDLRLEEVPVPRAIPGHSIVKVHYCGICGTDLNEYRHGPKMISLSSHPLSGQAPPLTLGHEFSGLVTSGESAEAPVGTRVTADACLRCNACTACRTGNYHLCRYGGSIGLHSDGAFAPYALIPDYCLVPLPDAVSDEAAALTEPFAVALHGLERGGIQAAADVVVLGFGPLGAAAATLARALGARTHVSELDPRRAEAAVELGFPLIEAGEGLPRRVRKALGSGGADLIFESTGVPAVLPEAINSTTRGGNIVQVGMGNGPASLEIERLVLFERALVGSLGYSHHLPKIVRMVELGRIDPALLIGLTVPLTAAVDTLAAAAQDPGPQIKILVDLHA